MTDRAHMAARVPALALAALVALAGCLTTARRGDQGPTGGSTLGAATAHSEEQLSASEYTSRAMERLQVGDAENARDDLERALALNPRSRAAKTLLDQLDADPEAELGTQYFEYQVRAGDSLSMLARKFLGDSRKFYILARYNDLDDPSKLDVGQTLKVPGTAKHGKSASAAAREAKPASKVGEQSANAPAATPRVTEGKPLAGAYDQAKALCANGDYEPAIEMLKSDRADARSRKLLGSCYAAYAGEKVSAEDLRGARALLASAVALDPSNRTLSTQLATIDDQLEAQMLYDRGVSQLRAGELESSLDSLNQALIFQPDYPAAVQKRNLVRKRLIDGYLKEADAAFTRHELDEAIAAWDQVLELDPGNQKAASRKKAALKSKAKL